MLSLFADQPTLARRKCLQIGGLSLLGLNTPQLQQLRAATLAQTPTTQPRAKSCVFIFLFGGPSHIDMWDMKPEAPLEVRGEFQSIATNVPDIRIGEHLPLLSQQMDKFCLLRSMTHKMSVHGPACSEIYSGRPYFGPPVTDQALPEDWPSIASMVARYGQSTTGLPASVVLPWYTQFVGQDKRIAGQTGGRMGEHWNPFLIRGDPRKQDFQVEGVRFPQEVTRSRFDRRRDLRQQLGKLSDRRTDAGELAELVDTNYAGALRLVETSQATNAFSLSEEPTAIRDLYGRTKFGQSLLLARRLVENDIPLVTVNWDDETKYDKVSPHWDTHHQNFPKLKNDLCPLFDHAFAGFLQDLDQRGLLETTMVVALGEFGRTPKIGLVTQNGMTEKTGRDHWPHAFTALVAGGGVRGGQAYGATTSNGGYIADKPVTPADLTATVFKHLGIDSSLTYYDEFQRGQQQLCVGRAVSDLG
ncbi:hypothetical protein Pan258_41970 [Symmachiella dynata]|uniref:DUF1501 domain-containing protein n=1 Tax=Symmachiella dynata TaxID=2527995 RepID=UPI0011880C67|nr:DUF1501 domain-containing protein [Symmachiella dynata]QDT50140.1 hypothetical protein Pan258_41970 [Symmachiella dynata]